MVNLEPRVVKVRHMAPDPSLARAVGRHHSFETALADLIDNSIDAGANHVLVRFLQRDGAITGLRLIDDGAGMDSSSIDSAMTFATHRDYANEDLGHFGIGLKAASLSQADLLSVYSRRLGSVVAGRAIRAADPTAVSDLDTADIESVLSDLHVDFTFDKGTVVEWGEPRTFISSHDVREQALWLDERIESLRSHLGIVFHRLLENKQIEIAVDVFDSEYRESSAPRLVRALDPFGYSALPHDSFPQPLRIQIDGGDATGMLHIWPPAQSGKPEFRLGGKPGALFQGFFFYRNGRLLQLGGWNTLVLDKQELEYARVAIDIDSVLAHHITINPEKAGLELDADLKSALLNASVGSDGRAFSTFLDDAEDARREARKYTKRPVALVRPDRGFDGDMLSAFEESVEIVRGNPVHIRWRVLTSEAPFAIDLDNRTIWLNEQYRSVIVGHGHTNAHQAHDAPLVKTLLLIVFSKYFEGEYLGAKQKLEIAAWEQLLTAALRDEITQQEQLERARALAREEVNRD